MNVRCCHLRRKMGEIFSFFVRFILFKIQFSAKVQLPLLIFSLIDWNWKLKKKCSMSAFWAASWEPLKNSLKSFCFFHSNILLGWLIYYEFIFQLIRKEWSRVYSHDLSFCSIWGPLGPFSTIIHPLRPFKPLWRLSRSSSCMVDSGQY